MQPVYGSSGCASFCPSYYVEEMDPSGELELAETLTEYIAYFLNVQYDDSYLFTNDVVTVSYYMGVIDDLDDSYDDVGFFSKGHRGRWPDDPWPHISLYDHYGDQVRDSEEIYPYSSQKFHFVFLWHCETSELYPSEEDEYGWVGMPYCFTHNNNMAKYGRYMGYHVFLGWENASPPVIDYVQEQSPWNEWQYAHWAYLFFYNLSEGGSVLDALDYASYEIYSNGFTCTPLYYDKLVVWGCMDIDLD